MRALTACARVTTRRRHHHGRRQRLVVCLRRWRTGSQCATFRHQHCRRYSRQSLHRRHVELSRSQGLSSDGSHLHPGGCRNTGLYRGRFNSARRAASLVFHQLAVDPLINLPYCRYGQQLYPAGFVRSRDHHNRSRNGHETAISEMVSPPPSRPLGFPAGVTIDNLGDILIADTANFPPPGRLSERDHPNDWRQRQPQLFRG